MRELPKFLTVENIMKMEEKLEFGDYNEMTNEEFACYAYVVCERVKEKMKEKKK